MSLKPVCVHVYACVPACMRAHVCECVRGSRPVAAGGGGRNWDNILILSNRLLSTEGKIYRHKRRPEQKHKHGMFGRVIHLRALSIRMHNTE